MDQKFGRFINHNLAEYHVPVNADVHDIEVIFVEEHDSIVNPLGAKGLGEPGVVGVASGHCQRHLPRDRLSSPRIADHARQAAGHSTGRSKYGRPPDYGGTEGLRSD